MNYEKLFIGILATCAVVALVALTALMVKTVWLYGVSQ